MLVSQDKEKHTCVHSREINAQGVTTLRNYIAHLHFVIFVDQGPVGRVNRLKHILGILTDLGIHLQATIMDNS